MAEQSDQTVTFAEQVEPISDGIFDDCLPLKGLDKKKRVFDPPSISPYTQTQISNDDVYALSKYPMGIMVIFNMDEFNDGSVRKGSEEDVQSLQTLFTRVGYVVIVYDNLTKDELMKYMRTKVINEVKSYSSVYITVLSHGKAECFWTQDRQFYKVRSLTKKLICKELADKPKVFLFQKCQGPNVIKDLEEVSAQLKKPIEKIVDTTLPAEADFLYAYATVFGFKSFREGDGSWFIQTLCKEFEKNYKTMDVVKMLTRVNREMATKGTSKLKQISSYTCQLRKDLYLCPIELK